MDKDTLAKRAAFIRETTEIRETFTFASPVEILRAVKLYAGSHYGNNLWMAVGQWECLPVLCSLEKLAWQVPRQAHTYFVDNLLSCDHSSVRMDILAKFGKFVKFRKCNSTSTSPAGDRCQCAKHQPDDGEGGSRAEEGHCAQ